jgi:OHCU decarboxylase
MTMDRKSFMARFGGIFEHSPWIVNEAWEQGVRDGDIEKLKAGFSRVIHDADRDRQVALLRAHPQLASAIASDEEITDESRGEQKSVGLDQCSPAEFDEFNRLNGAYTNKFGFPFIIAVKGLDRDQILEIFRSRLENSPEDEFREALRQVIRIGAFRLHDIAARGEKY